MIVQHGRFWCVVTTAVMALSCWMGSANAAVTITNGSFEPPNAGTTGVSGIELVTDWTAENLETVGGIQNATWTVDQENVTAEQITGTQWLRLVGDVGQEGGLNQPIGSLLAGEAIVIGGDYFTGGNAGPVIAYEPIIELYDGDPLVAGSMLATAVLAGGALDGASNNSSTFLLDFTAAADLPSLFLRMRTNSTAPADNGGNNVVTRGGIDNVRLVPEPATLVLFGLGLAGLAAVARRRE